MSTEWTAPKTWTVGEVLPAADLNTYVRDNTLYHHDPPRCAVRLTSTQTVTNATDHPLAWDEAVWDSHGDMWDVGAPGTVTITRDGVYSIHCATLWGDSTDAGKRAIFMDVDGTRRRGIQVPAVSPSEIVLSVETNVGAGQAITFDVRQLSGGDLDLQPLRTVATVRWVAAVPASGE